MFHHLSVPFASLFLLALSLVSLSHIELSLKPVCTFRILVQIGLAGTYGLLPVLGKVKLFGCIEVHLRLVLLALSCIEPLLLDILQVLVRLLACPVNRLDSQQGLLGIAASASLVHNLLVIIQGLVQTGHVAVDHTQADKGS